MSPTSRAQVERIVEIYVDNEADKAKITDRVLRAVETRQELWTTVKTVVTDYGFTGKDVVVLTNNIVQTIFNYGSMAKKHWTDT